MYLWQEADPTLAALLTPKGSSLCELLPRDAEDFFGLIDRNRAHLSQFGDDTSAKYPDLESVLRRIEESNPDELRMGIWHEQPVGFIRLHFIFPNVAVLGYWMGAEFTGRGLMSDAVRTLAAYARQWLEVGAVLADVHCANLASQRVLAKSGFVTYPGGLPIEPPHRDHLRVAWYGRDPRD